MDKLPKIYAVNKFKSHFILNSKGNQNSSSLSLFLGDCNFRCSYCMNRQLVIGKKPESIPFDEIEALIKPHEWVLISGGEPTCTPIMQLKALISIILEKNAYVAMSTNGTNPDVIEELIKSVDYVLLDIKAADEEIYSCISATNENVLPKIKQSLNILNERTMEPNSPFDYEVRTTLYPPYIGKKQLQEIDQMLPQKAKWILQQFRPGKNLLDVKANDITPYSDSEISDLILTIDRPFDLRFV